MLHLPNKHLTFSLKLSYRTETLQLAAPETHDSGLSVRRTDRLQSELSCTAVPSRRGHRLPLSSVQCLSWDMVRQFLSCNVVRQFLSWDRVRQFLSCNMVRQFLSWDRVRQFLSCNMVRQFLSWDRVRQFLSCNVVRQFLSWDRVRQFLSWVIVC